MFNAKPAAMRNLSVTGIAMDPGTLEGLGHYLRRRVAYRGVFAADEPSEESMRSDCVVLYPDGLPLRAAQRLARRLISCPTVSLVIIVTALPAAERQTLVGSRSASNCLIFLPIPAWPWTVFATIESSLPGRYRAASQQC